MVIISIIVPVYKVEKYLKRCVMSLVNQTLKDMEIILVDDGSPDKPVCGEEMSHINDSLSQEFLRNKYAAEETHSKTNSICNHISSFRTGS